MQFGVNCVCGCAEADEGVVVGDGNRRQFDGVVENEFIVAEMCLC